MLSVGSVPEDGLVLRRSAQRQMLPTEPLRSALYIGTRANGRAARHEIATRCKVRGWLATRPARTLKPAAPKPVVILDGGHDLRRVVQNVGVYVVDGILLSRKG